MRIKLISILLFLLLSVVINAQELLLPLEINPAKAILSPQLNTSLKTTTDTVKLPFIDDFTNNGPFPDQKLWVDSFVFVNTSYGLHPKTYGVATFDALNQYGEVYEAAITSPYQFAADLLTSKPIRLDSLFIEDEKYLLTPADSVMISFYYQPQGRGVVPLERDSLVLQFLSKADDDFIDKEGETVEKWITVWSATGESLESFAGNDFPYFKRVIIVIEDEEFFRKDFQFRFKNYASFPAGKSPNNYAGNTSIWNIDYVYLASGRSVNDFYYHDIAFVEPAESLLQNYTAMPWSHYIVNPQQHLKSNFNVVFTNLDQITYNYSYRYYITDEDDNLIRNYSGGTWNIAPFSESGYQNYPAHTNPAVISNPLPTAPADERTFYITHVIREGAQGDSYQRNDTIVYKQEFSNYFAYDDGVSEAGYGLSGWNPKLAYRFVAAKSDMLESVSFYFNRTRADVNQKPFYLTVWKSLLPEVILYQSSSLLMPEFGEELNQFVNYTISSGVLVTDTFYVGLVQNTSDFLNIGYDVNNNAGNNIFFNADGQWQQSMFSGALMIRPVFNHLLSAPNATTNEVGKVHLFPNPISDNYLNISIIGNIATDAVIQVFDIKGIMVLQELYNEKIDISSLPSGTYILRLINSGRELSPVRFIKIPR